MNGALSNLSEFISCAAQLGSTPRQKFAILWRLTKNVRVRAGVARYQPEQVYSLPTRYRTVFLRDNFGDVTNLPGLFCRCEYGVSRLAHEGVVIDIGANIGLFAAWIAHHNPGREIHCFEPLASNARMIAMNCPSAVVNQVGLGKSPGSVRVNVDLHGIMASSISTRWQTQETEVTIVPLDRYVEQHAIERIAFMKIDTEGMELDILAGATDALRITRQLAMETHGVDRHRGAIEWLSASGFNIATETFDGSTGLVFAAR